MSERLELTWWWAFLLLPGVLWGLGVFKREAEEGWRRWGFVALPALFAAGYSAWVALRTDWVSWDAITPLEMIVGFGETLVGLAWSWVFLTFVLVVVNGWVGGLLFLLRGKLPKASPTKKEAG